MTDIFKTDVIQGCSNRNPSIDLHSMTSLLKIEKKKGRKAILKNYLSSFQSLPVKFPPITYGMTPPGHILSVRDVAALGNRFFSFFPENFTVVLPLDVLFCSKPAMIIKTLNEITYT